ncbi:MAG: tetratricopeptide repeat protein [Deltaproteobacteria bacterium]|nr:MAG: tetratricopeptide repeat protein [Deltaproteobacteria bacterium]
MTVDEARDRAELLADDGSFDDALALLAEARTGAGRAGALALRIDEGAVLARAGRLDEALAVLEIAEASAVGLPLLGAEARVMRGSVLGALGRFDEALPLLRRAVSELEKLDAPELLADAKAELRSFGNLTSPKHAGTWASLLRRD